MKNSEDLWWGFSPEHGWVVLDRSIGRNKPGTAQLLFFRCSDEVFFQDDRKRWKPPYYVFAPRYFESLPKAEQNASQHKLDFLKKAFERRALQIARSQFFDRIRKDDPGLRPATNRFRRVTHCYDCKHPLDSVIDYECNKCGWLVCDCGACGCGYNAP